MGWGTTNVSAGGGEEDKLKAHLENKNNPHGVTAEQVGAAKADHTHTAAQVGARPNTWTPKLADVAFLGNQPISAVANDTIENWATLGSGYAWYCTGGLLNNQPSPFGFLVSYVNGLDVSQIWRSQDAGPTYMRSGNANGWASAWVQVSMDGHTHDDRYYTETETNNLLAGKANASHTHPVGNITGVLPVSKGGTGQTSLTALMSAMGAGKIVAGTYTGNGNESMTINLGFTPKAVLLLPADNGVSMLYECYGFNNNQYSNPRESALCIQGQTILNGSYKVMSVEASGFTVYCYLIDAGNRYQTNYYCRGNESGKKFNYVAFG